MPVPLFVCHANCCRSLLAEYLYRSLGGAAHSAGVVAGPELSDRAEAMLRCWASTPRATDRGGPLAICAKPPTPSSPGAPCTRPACWRSRDGTWLGCYLFADPFSLPAAFAAGECQVRDPSFDTRPPKELTREFAWFRERVAEIRASLEEARRPGSRLVPASRYLGLVEEILRSLTP